jgi:hypothetical protein
MSRLILAASALLAIPASSFAQQSASPSSASFAAGNDSGEAMAIFETKDAAGMTAGLTPLSKTELKKNEREVRIWYSGFGNPQFLVVIHQVGNVTTGRLLLWWDQYYENDPATADARVDNFVRANYDCGTVSKRDSHFGEDRWVSSVCEAKLKGAPEWKAFLAEVEAHALPQSTQGVAEDESDGSNWGITVERRSGTNYGFSHYHTAVTLGTPEPGRGPKLQEMLTALAATAKRESTLAQH